MCAAWQSSLPAEIATALSVAVPNQQSAAAALNLAQTAALCRDYGAREKAIRLLAGVGLAVLVHKEICTRRNIITTFPARSLLQITLYFARKHGNGPLDRTELPNVVLCEHG
jgi:hypothetical protein